MRVKKLCVIFGFLFFVLLFLTFVSAAEKMCEIKERSACSDGWYPLLGLSGTSNAHGEVYNSNNYLYALCCNFGDGIQSNECSTGTTILKLSSLSNAHAEASSQNNYANSVCYIGETGFNFLCQTITSGSCPAGYNHILSLSSTTNAHIGGPDDYQIKICCNVASIPPKISPYAYWSNSAAGTSINSIDLAIGGNVYMLGKNLNDYITENDIILEIYEKDTFSDDLIKTIHSTINTDGSFSASWVVQDADLQKTNDFFDTEYRSPTDYDFDAFYFKVTTSAGAYIITSNDLTLTLIPGLGTEPYAYWSDEDGNKIYYINKVILGTTPIFMFAKNLADYEGEQLLLKIYERDNPLVFNPDDLIRTETASVSQGSISTYWTVTEEDLQKTGESGGGTGTDSFDEFYFEVRGDAFEVRGDANELIATSNDLTLTIDRNGEPPPREKCIDIDFCKDYKTKLECDADDCDVGDNGAPAGVDCSDPNIDCGCWWNEDEKECNINVNYLNTYCGDSEVQRPNSKYMNEQCDPDGENGPPVFLSEEDSCIKLTQNLNMDTYRGGTLGCTRACLRDISKCIGAPPFCGDNVKNTFKEDCDGNDLQGKTCKSLGFAGGTLKCYANTSEYKCEFDTSLCGPCSSGSCCGDSKVQRPNSNYMNEQCDPDGENGTPVFLSEEDSCTKLTQNLNMDTYTEGTLGCRRSCIYDVSKCIGAPPICGDNVTNQDNEECDGIDLQTYTCKSLGFAGGTLKCTNCKIDSSQCDKPDEVAGSCQITQDMNDTCDEGGVLSFDWIGSWIGTIPIFGSSLHEQYQKCISGGADTILCPSLIQLPFFSTYNAFAIIILAIIIYLIISLRKNKERKNAKIKRKR